MKSENSMKKPVWRGWLGRLAVGLALSPMVWIVLNLIAGALGSLFFAFGGQIGREIGDWILRWTLWHYTDERAALGSALVFGIGATWAASWLNWAVQMVDPANAQSVDS